MKALLTVVLVAVLFASMGIAQAGQATYTGNIPLSTTNWSSSIDIPKFDPSLGTLDKITFVLIGHVEGLAKFESMESISADITANLCANLYLMRPDASVIVVSMPVASITESVGSFDGTIDFGGTSGRTYPALTADKSETAIATPPDPDIALFTGLGNITLPVSAVGTSCGSGAGNLLMQFNTLASAEARVTYDYTSVPEPSSLLALLTGVAGLASWTLRRRRD